jgi:hypothetical protein
MVKLKICCTVVHIAVSCVIKFPQIFELGNCGLSSVIFRVLISVFLVIYVAELQRYKLHMCEIFEFRLTNVQMELLRNAAMSA